MKTSFKTLSAAAALLASVIVALPVAAGVDKWQVIRFVDGSGGQHCATNVTRSDELGYRAIHFEQAAGDPASFFMSLSKKGWRTPEQPKTVQLIVGIEDAAPVALTGSTIKIKFLPEVGEVKFINIYPMNLFIDALLTSNPYKEFWIYFMDGNEPSWRESLLGAAEAIRAVRDCKPVPSTTQPFGS